MLSPLLCAPLCPLVVDAGVQLGGDVLGRAAGLPGFLSCSFLGPLALAKSRRAPPTAAAAVPLTTGAAAFTLGVEHPAFFTFFALDASPGLLVVPGPSDFMAAVFSESLLVLCTRGLSGAAGGHFTALGCGNEQKRAMSLHRAEEQPQHLDQGLANVLTDGPQWVLSLRVGPKQEYMDVVSSLL